HHRGVGPRHAGASLRTATPATGRRAGHPRSVAPRRAGTLRPHPLAGCERVVARPGLARAATTGTGSRTGRGRTRCRTGSGQAAGRPEPRRARSGPAVAGTGLVRAALIGTGFGVATVGLDATLLRRAGPGGGSLGG